MTKAGTGWEREKRTHFDEIVVRYDRTRPEYPPALFADLFDYAGATDGRLALEIGPGTGKATGPILDAGYNVTGVELGANMADFLRHRFADHSHFNVIVAAFEDVPLEAEHYDLVYAASAIHWMDAGIACPKAYRALRKGGVFALLRYNSVPDCGNACYDEIQKAYEAHYFTHYAKAKRLDRRSKEDFLQPDAIRQSYGFADLGDFGFRDVSMRFYDKSLAFDADAYIAFLDTMADNRGLPEPNRAALYAAIREAITRHGGRYHDKHVFRLYVGRK